jgi:hypothetical protein
MKSCGELNSHNAQVQQPHQSRDCEGAGSADWCLTSRTGWRKGLVRSRFGYMPGGFWEPESIARLLTCAALMGERVCLSVWFKKKKAFKDESLKA